MNRIPSSIALLIVPLFVLAPAFAQAPQPPSSYYPAPPPEQAPTVQQGAPLSGLSSPLPASAPKVDRTEIASDAEAQLFADARRIVWGRYAKVKGAKPGDVAVTRQGNLWVVKGRIDSVAPGSEGDWASIDGVVERISAGHVQIRGEVAFRVAKVEKGIALQGGRRAQFPPFRQVAGVAPGRGRQSLRRDARELRSGLRKAGREEARADAAETRLIHRSTARSFSISSRASWSARSFSA